MDKNSPYIKGSIYLWFEITLRKPFFKFTGEPTQWLSAYNDRPVYNS
jgi:hypothetical protein